jgi:hypothetical protein
VPAGIRPCKEANLPGYHLPDATFGPRARASAIGVLMSLWARLHKSAWWWRWPAKWVLFILVVVLVLYPKLWLAPRWVARLSDMDSVLQPDCPGLAEFEAAVRARAPAPASAADVLPVVERVVYERIPYAWDWDVWGVVDYLPTVAEVLQQGREDCDGRAVVAASLLRRLGYQAWLASDLKHTWVVTSSGETMSPGAGEKTIAAGPGGTQVRFTAGLLENVARGLSYGLAVFPLTRELLILAALCALTMQPRSSAGRRVAGCLLLLLALGLLRDAGLALPKAGASSGLTWAALTCMMVGWLALAIKAGGRRSPGAPPG